MMPRRAHWSVWGVTAALLYLGTLIAGRPLPALLLYDGVAPLPPYRWVHPPAAREKDNQAPESGTATLSFGTQGSPAAEVATADDQALATFPQAAIAPRPGESSVKVVITPLDAASVAPAPNGQTFDGNGYRIAASYVPSGTPTVLAAPVTVVLRYAVHATRLLRNQDRGWIALAATRFDGSQQVLATTDRLGLFAAAEGRTSREAPGRQAGAYAAARAGLLASLAGAVGGRARH